jgi:glycosyltransferase involved in cell wall biosynthesis
MRILFLSQLLPYPPDAGAKVRSYHLIQYLAQRGHEVTLVAFRRPSDRAADIEHMKQYCSAVHTVPMNRSRVRDLWHLGRSVVSRSPFLIARDHIPAMHRKIEALLASSQFDAVHVDQLWMAQYALAARDNGTGAGQRPLLVLDQHNAVFVVAQRLAESSTNRLARKMFSRESALLQRYEQEVCAQFDRVVWVTNEDRAALGGAAGLTIPICINPDEKTVVQRAPHAHRVTFLGGLHWPPNADGVRWFASQVWPRVAELVPGALLTVIGKDPPAEVDPALVPQLEAPGFVRDLAPYLSETAVFIVPLHAGGGMRVKILDAWAWGLPVVSTTIGAEGLAYGHGENLLIADTEAEFAEAVARVLRDSALRQRLAQGGRSTVEACYDWRHAYKAWDAIYG